MEITIKGRHWKLTPAFKNYATERIERLNRYHARLIRADLVVTRDGYRHEAELRLHGNSVDLLSKAVDPDPRTALDAVLEKQERALLRRKGKLRDRKKRGPTVRLEEPVAPPKLPRTVVPSVSVIRERPSRPVMSVDEAAEELLKGRKPVLVFSERGTEAIRVAYRLGKGQVGLLELD
jgi:putative sigma-54 modulation protein